MTLQPTDDYDASSDNEENAICNENAVCNVCSSPVDRVQYNFHSAACMNRYPIYNLTITLPVTLVKELFLIQALLYHCFKPNIIKATLCTVLTDEHHIISIISYCIVSYRIVSYRIVSYRIVSYRIVSYHIISYHII